MHRSGTSAVSRVLSLRGAALPKNLMDPAGGMPEDGNSEAGFWESEVLRQLHDEMLEAAGSSWDDATGFSSDWSQSEAAAGFSARLEETISEEFEGAPLFVVKDPRMCRFVPIWCDVLDRMGIRAGFVIVIRSPLDVAASLRRRDGIPPAKSMLAWLHHFLAAERDTRGGDRVFITYDGLLDDWKTVVSRVASSLSIKFPRAGEKAEAEIAGFLDRGLRHHFEPPEAISERPDLSDWVRTAFEWALEAAEDGRPDPGVLDRIYAEVLKAEVAFGPFTDALENTIAEQHRQLEQAHSSLERSEDQDLRLRHLEDRLSGVGSDLSTHLSGIDRQHSALRSWVEDALGQVTQALRDRVLSLENETTGTDAVVGERFVGIEGKIERLGAGLDATQKDITEHVTTGSERSEVQTRRIERLEAELSATQKDLVKRATKGSERSADQGRRIKRLEAGLDRARGEAAERITTWSERAAVQEKMIEQLEAQHEQSSARVMETVKGFVALRQDLGRIEDLEEELTELCGVVLDREPLGPEITKLRHLEEELRARILGTDHRLGHLETSLADRLEGVRKRVDQLAERADTEERERRAHLGAVSSGLVRGSALSRRSNTRRSLYSNSFSGLAGVVAGYAIRGRLKEPWRWWRGARRIRRSGLFDVDFYLSQYPDVVQTKIDPIVHFLAWGAAEHRNPNRAFDTRFYQDHHGDRLRQGENPLVHYVRTGADDGLATSASFDTEYYRQTHPDVAAADVNPLLHYLNVGFWQGRQSCPPDQASLPPAALVAAEPSSEFKESPTAGAEPIPVASSADIGTDDREVRLIAFYLPQFHPIPENDLWWGQGFTEWTNVAQARPLFQGHQQPVLPSDLGFYDLRLPEVLQEQSALASQYGIFGFCFYVYWFAGRRLLERPLENFLKNKDINRPFCVCWANENWTRNWDGEDQQVLLSQKHSVENDERFITDMLPLLQDPRYIRIDGQPLLVVYRPDLLANPAETAELWRRKCREAGLPGLHLCAVGWKVDDPLSIGFDAIVEFPPHSLELIDFGDEVKPFDPDFDGRILDYRAAVERVKDRSDEGFPVYRGVMPAWDNTARRGSSAWVYKGSTPDLYQDWLTRMVQETAARPAGSAKLVFVNSWNEWAEGAMLEPSNVYGRGYLEATEAALSNGNAAPPPVEEGFPKWRLKNDEAISLGTDAIPTLVISHDAARAGAQLTLLETMRGLQDAAPFELFFILCDGGEIEDEFASVGHVLNLSGLDQDEGVIRAALDALRIEGLDRDIELAFCNTVVTSHMAADCAAAGLPVLSFVWELPTSIRGIFGEQRVREIVESSRRIVVASDFARRELSREFGVDAEVFSPVHIGFLGELCGKSEREQGRKEVLAELGLEKDAFLVLGCGTVHHRKGTDLFVQAAKEARRFPGWERMTFLWVGGDQTGPTFREWCEHDATYAELGDKVVFLGNQPSTARYFAAADAFALTSREDPFPRVVMEAMAHDTPVVAFADAGGAPEALADGCGVVVPYLNVREMARSLSQLAEAPRYSDEIRTRSRKRMESEYSWQAYIEKILEILTEDFGCRFTKKRAAAEKAVTP